MLVAAALPGRAQEATREFDPLGESNDLPKLIRVQVEFIEVPHETLTELMSGEVQHSDLKLRAQVGDLVKTGAARMVETQMLMARPGQKATAESIEEYIYPTEYEPAELPNEIHTTAEGEKVKSDGREYATGPTPTAFETRNLGSTIEIEPNLGVGDRIIDLRFSPELVYHVGNQVWAEWNGKYGKSPIQMPIMYSIRVSLGVTLINGETRMVAAVSPKSEDGFPDFERKLMIFVRATVLTVGR
jgi:hypothetical protein